MVHLLLLRKKQMANIITAMRMELVTLTMEMEHGLMRMVILTPSN